MRAAEQGFFIERTRKKQQEDAEAQREESQASQQLRAGKALYV
jgi:hypothetical protein